MNDDELISRNAAKAACQKVADEAKSYGIPQMTMGANTCRDAIIELPAADMSELTRLRATVAELTQANAQFVVRVEEARGHIACLVDKSRNFRMVQDARAWLGGAK